MHFDRLDLEARMDLSVSPFDRRYEVTVDGRSFECARVETPMPPVTRPKVFYVYDDAGNVEGGPYETEEAVWPIPVTLFDAVERS